MEFQDDPLHCNTLLSCFMLILYKGVPAGDLSAVLDDVDRTSDKFTGRVIFDLSFFMIFGILLFNVSFSLSLSPSSGSHDCPLQVVTGLIVDTFSSIRERAEAREDQLANECFVCGYTRAAYDDSGYHFDDHVFQDHYLWNYLFFIAYLREKDQNDYNGVESFVYNMLDSGSQDWIPARTSWRLEVETSMKRTESEREHAQDHSLIRQLKDLQEEIATSVVTQIQEELKEMVAMAVAESQANQQQARDEVLASRRTSMASTA